MSDVWLPALLVGNLLVLLLLLWRSFAVSNRSGQEDWARLDTALRQLEQALRQELAQSRREDAEEAFRDREERAQASNRLVQAITTQVSSFGSQQGERLESLRAAVEQRLQALQADNAKRLEAMRQTVDEKLQATLEQRLGESFRLVSERLEQVQRGLGEMHSLAAGVGDLKRVLGNVRTRGSWGEVQLAGLLAQVLTAEQYVAQAVVHPESRERVDFAIRLPGLAAEQPVWLPIDAKFPLEDYQRLLEAQDRADLAGVEEAGRALEARLRAEARSVREKYVCPPHTTDFALLYLPIEGLYAEALRRPGLVDALQRDFRVSLAGPTTLAALLNSLQMGFRTLAIEQRSAEVWGVLGAVKGEFLKFGEALAHTRRKLEEASTSIGKAETRSRVLGRRLQAVEVMPGSTPALTEADE